MHKLSWNHEIRIYAKSAERDSFFKLISEILYYRNILVKILATFYICRDQPVAAAALVPGWRACPKFVSWRKIKTTIIFSLFCKVGGQSHSLKILTRTNFFKKSWTLRPISALSLIKAKLSDPKRNFSLEHWSILCTNKLKLHSTLESIWDL